MLHRFYMGFRFLRYGPDMGLRARACLAFNAFRVWSEGLGSLLDFRRLGYPKYPTPQSVIRLKAYTPKQRPKPGNPPPSSALNEGSESLARMCPYILHTYHIVYPQNPRLIIDPLAVNPKPPRPERLSQPHHYRRRCTPERAEGCPRRLIGTSTFDDEVMETLGLEQLKL